MFVLNSTCYSIHIVHFGAPYAAAHFKLKEQLMRSCWMIHHAWISHHVITWRTVRLLLEIILRLRNRKEGRLTTVGWTTPHTLSFYLISLYYTHPQTLFLPHAHTHPAPPPIALSLHHTHSRSLTPCLPNTHSPWHTMSPFTPRLSHTLFLPLIHSLSLTPTQSLSLAPPRPQI